MDQLQQFLVAVDGSVIECDAQIPDEYVKDFVGLGCFGMHEYTDRSMAVCTCRK
uniref:Uncharacterized protein n=1 Tax=Mycobacterium leprae TaxID=1769 RepID=O33054_MYCLR|nr:hypothetical protein MLCB57.13 [Mycobacterium leprae]